MYRKVFALLCAVILAAAAAGCSNDNSGSGADASTPPVQTAEVSPSMPADDISAEEGKRIADEWLQNCLDGNYDAAYIACDDTMKGVFDQGGGLDAMWESLAGQFGNYISHADAGSGFKEGYYVCTTDIVFEKSEIQASVSVDMQGKVAGVYFAPKQQEPAKAPLPDTLEQQEITVDAGKGYPLQGLITYPKGGENLPCVVLVQGSGASGMDQVIGQNRTFEQLANGLAERGLAVIRFDKRTYTYPECANTEDFSVADEYIEDFIAAVKLAAERPEVDGRRIFLIGHSQGGMLAPRIAAEGAEVAGMVLLAGTPRNMAELLQDQQALMAADLEAADNQTELETLRSNQSVWLEEYEALQSMDEAAAKQAGTVYTMPAWYLYDMMNYTPAIGLIKGNDLPVLILQGENDVQVYADKDFELYKEGLADYGKADFKLYGGLNHLFMPSQAEGLQAGIAEYEQAGEIDAQVMDDIAEWVEGIK